MKKLIISLFTNIFCIVFLTVLFALNIFLFALNFTKEVISRDLFIDISLISIALVWACCLGFVARNIYLWSQYTVNTKRRQIIIAATFILLFLTVTAVSKLDANVGAKIKKARL